MIKRNQEYVLKYGENVKPQRVLHIGPSEPFSNRPDYCAFINCDMKSGTILMHHIQQGNFRVNGEEIEVINPHVPVVYIEAYTKRSNQTRFNELSQLISRGEN